MLGDGVAEEEDEVRDFDLRGVVGHLGRIFEVTDVGVLDREVQGKVEVMMCLSESESVGRCDA